MTEWFARPVLHVSNVEASLRFYVDSRGVSIKEGQWGYRVLVVEDLDGNQLFFPYPNAPGVDPEGLVRT